MPEVIILNEAKRMLLAGELALDTDDLRAALVMTNTSVDDQNAGITRMVHFSTLDEYDHGSYSRIALQNKAVTKDDDNDRAAFFSDDLAFGSISAGTRSAQAVVIYKRVDGTAANDIPLVVIELDADTAGNGTPFIVECPDVGWWVLS